MYKKLTATQIFNGFELLPVGRTLIMDEKGKILDILPTEEAGDNIEWLEGWLCPGFVNAHCHIELSHLKNVIEERTGLVSFVQQVMTKRDALHSLREAAMQQALIELHRSGTVAVGDICNTTDSLSVKTNSPIHWHNFIEVAGFVNNVADFRIQQLAPVYQAFQNNSFPPNLFWRNTWSPHAPYSVSSNLFEKINHLTKDQLLSIHNQECAAENELYINKTGDFLKLFEHFKINIAEFQQTGKSSLQSWLPFFSNQQSIISVHNTFTSQDDIDFVKKNALTYFYYCLCVNANIYIENTLPPIDLLRKNDCMICLGTDSFASNKHLSILEEIKTIQQHYSNKMPMTEILKWATFNGAKALQMDSLLGSFEKGKTPGTVHINVDENQRITTAVLLS